MDLPTTTLYYLIGGLILIIIATFTHLSYKRAGKPAMHYLSLVFLFLGLHALAFAAPTIFQRENLALLGYGYILGIALVFATLIVGLRVLHFMTNLPDDAKRISFARIGIWALAIFTVSIMIYDFNLPEITEEGIILWNTSLLAKWLIGLSSFIYGTFWSYVIFGASKLIPDTLDRLKLQIIGADGFILGFVGLIVHTSTSETQSLIGHIIFLGACIMTLLIYIIPRRPKESFK